jgi:hypothetical protein
MLGLFIVNDLELGDCEAGSGGLYKRLNSASRLRGNL